MYLGVCWNHIQYCTADTYVSCTFCLRHLLGSYCAVFRVVSLN